MATQDSLGSSGAPHLTLKRVDQRLWRFDAEHRRGVEKPHTDDIGHVLANLTGFGTKALVLYDSSKNLLPDAQQPEVGDLIIYRGGSNGILHGSPSLTEDESLTEDQSPTSVNRLLLQAAYSIVNKRCTVSRTGSVR